MISVNRPGNTPFYLSAVWLAIFAALAALTALTARGAMKLYAATGELNSLRSALNADAAQAGELSGEIDRAEADLSYFDELAATYPDNKGYFRTQNAIAAETRELRKKVGQKVGGRLYIAVDSRANKLYLKRGTRLLWEADCSVGRGGTLRDRKTGRIWEFATPRGEFSVRYKIDSPAWLKPDWAYVENGEPVPPRDDPSRLVQGELGEYALDIGDGYLIHGTRNENALGASVSHGCVRLGADALEKLYKAAPVGTKVYIY